MNVVGMNGGLRSEGNDRSGKLSFYNMRAEWWWGLREALDPLLGVDLALPPGREVLADLAAPRFEIRPGGKLLIESKQDIRRRLGRSPDIGDAITYAYALGGIQSGRKALNKIRRGNKHRQVNAGGGRLAQRRR